MAAAAPEMHRLTRALRIGQIKASKELEGMRATVPGGSNNMYG